jgi:hypothetical protein
MSERSSTLVEITRDAPCEGRREELLRLVTQGPNAVGATGARRHVSRCRRCRAFVDTAALGQRLAGEAFASVEAEPSAKPATFDFTRRNSFENWLDRELWQYGREAVANMLARTARWLLRLDPDVAEKVGPTEVELVGAEERTVPQAQVAATFRRHLLAFTNGPVATRQRRRLDSLLAGFENLEQLGGSSAGRKDLAAKLSNYSVEVSAGQSVLPLIVRSLVTWFGDTTKNLESQIEAATLVNGDADLRATALLNHALLDAEWRFPASPLRSLERALEIRPRRRVTLEILRTRSLWHAAAGDDARCVADLRRLQALGGLELARRRMPIRIINDRLRFLRDRHSLDDVRVASAAALLREALHD